ncbi:hypothetical protein JI435_403300 [Parastagonospora nodorum SN15]|uniref:Uncharacterized protein n=1 Tax=Phaeosphaeria nodorum (strain SN15 / ATCC MYA-4574 / FGSC 10173) TaxID=321614 RepID=A0A7U2EY33_PHANO|nr:hypothetical protein JI435_403300 [Parastagonospora nodorum SN15]
MLLANPPKNGTSYLSNIPASTYAFQLNHAIPPNIPDKQHPTDPTTPAENHIRNTPPHGGSIRYANMAS